YQLCQPGQPATPCVTTANLGVLNTDGSATLRINARISTTLGTPLATLTGIASCLAFGFIPICYTTTISVPIALFGDHDVVDPSNVTYNWFYRNRWPEVAYYAVAAGIAPSGARSCTTSSTCLQLNYSADAGKHRSLLIIGGQKLATLDAGGTAYSQSRPATLVKDLLDDFNAAGTSPFALASATLATD